MPPKPKDAKKGAYKVGTPLKDILPPTIKQPIREGRPSRVPEYTATQTVINPYKSHPEFEQWPGDEAAANYDFGLASQTATQFADQIKFPLPPSFISKESHIIFWRRPKELVKTQAYNENLRHSAYVASESQFGRRKSARALTEMQEGGSILLPEDSGTSPFDGEDVELEMFKQIERLETAEEAEARVKELTEKQLQDKAKKKTGKKEDPIDPTPQKIKDIKLSNINLSEDLPAYSKWIASQLQIIKDRNLRDVNVSKVLDMVNLNYLLDKEANLDQSISPKGRCSSCES